MKVQYIANDGKIFEDENECLDYENQIMCNTEFKGCLFYDHSKQKFPISDSTIEDIWFMHFETLDQLEKFKELSDKIGISIDGLYDINENFSLDFYYDEGEYPQKFKQYNNETNELIKRINLLQREKDELFYNNF